MKVTAIIPVYNGGRYIGQAIRSIQRQNYPGMEIIVVDDGSTDDTAKVVRAFEQVRYEYQQNQGPGAARNRGLLVATGDVIAFCDSDDQWTDDKLAMQIPLLEESPRPGVVIGFCQRVRVPLNETGPDAVDNPAACEKFGDPVFYLTLGNSLISRHAFEEIGGFAERLPSGQDELAGQYGEDLDWYLRAKEAGIRIRFHREVVLFYRRHDQNLTLDRNRVTLSVVREVKRSLDRRRAEKQFSMLDWSRETTFE